MTKYTLESQGLNPWQSLEERKSAIEKVTPANLSWQDVEKVMVRKYHFAQEEIRAYLRFLESKNISPVDFMSMGDEQIYSLVSWEFGMYLEEIQYVESVMILEYLSQNMNVVEKFRRWIIIGINALNSRSL